MGVADRLLLDVANRRRLGADITRAVLSVERTGSMEKETGYPALSVVVEDPREAIMHSNVLVRPAIRGLGSPQGFALRPIDVLVDGVWYRLRSAEREGDTTTFEFRHRGVVYMGGNDTPMSASRNDRTRALFIRRQVDEVARTRGAGHRLAFWAREVRRRMPIAPMEGELSTRSEPDRDVTETPARASDAQGITVKGVKAKADQRRNMAIGQEVADELHAGPRATLALHVAGIGESDYRDVPNSEGSKYRGVWQSDRKYNHTTREQARLFLKGGEGYQGGGAIAYARKNPGATPGDIATAVEASGKPGAFYNKHRREAEAIMEALGGVAVETGDVVGGSYVKPYRFRRERGKDAWTNTGDLAEEVGRRRFVTIPRRGTDLFVYAGDLDLLRLRSQAVIDVERPYVRGFGYGLDYGKSARVAHLEVRGDAFEPDFAWGLPVILEESAGGAVGKWLVWDVHEKDGSPWVELELRQPEPTKLEPAPEIVQRASTGDSPADDDGSASSKVYSKAYAISERNYPYVWGGGHSVAGRPDGGTGRDSGTGYDCSGYVAACLLAGGMLPDEWKRGVPGSGTFASSYGEAGKGKHVTVWANGGHVFLELDVKGKKGKWADTSRQAGGAAGPHVRYGDRSTAGFTARHWPGT